MLKLKNVNLYVNDKTLFKNLNMKISSNEVHVFLGKNGVGKSSIVKAIMGDNNYRVEGSISYNDHNLNDLSIYERSKLGIYLVNQSPIQIEGVTNAEMLRVCLSEKSDEPINIFAFNKELEAICKKLELDKSFIHREINVGCSGGERKKIELLHMWMLKPSLIMLDEIDSGLDVDAVKLVQKQLKEYYEMYHPTIIMITHSASLIEAFEDIKVHVFDKEKLVKSGEKDLALDILKNGFQELSSSFDISEKETYE